MDKYTKSCKCGCNKYNEDKGVWIDKDGKEKKIDYCDICSCFLDNDGEVICAIID